MAKKGQMKGIVFRARRSKSKAPSDPGRSTTTFSRRPCTSTRRAACYIDLLARDLLARAVAPQGLRRRLLFCLFGASGSDSCGRRGCPKYGPRPQSPPKIQKRFRCGSGDGRADPSPPLASSRDSRSYLHRCEDHRERTRLINHMLTILSQKLMVAFVEN